MARLAMTGFEMGVIPFTAVGTPTFGGVGTARTGSYDLLIDATTEGMIANLGSTITSTYARVAFYAADTTSASKTAIMTFVNSVNGQQIAIGFVPNTLQLAAWRCDSATDGNTVQLGVGQTLVHSTWYVIEVYVLIHASTGKVQVKVDGVTPLDIDFTGDTTTFTYTPNDIRYVALAKSNATGYITAGCYGHYDDFAVNDITGTANASWCGRGGIEALVTTGAGASTDLTPSTGNNWDCVDEIPASDADYVSGDVIDDYDAYEMSNPIYTGGVTAVCAWIRGSLSEAGAGSVAPVIRVGAGESTGADIGLDTTWRLVKAIYDVNPINSQTWTISNLNDLQLGVKVR
jgi:hypothetical protein